MLFHVLLKIDYVFWIFVVVVLNVKIFVIIAMILLYVGILLLLKMATLFTILEKRAKLASETEM